MPLYGHELTEEIDPLSAGLNFAVNLDKDDNGGDGPEIPPFVGQAALKKIADDGPAKTRIGLKLDGKRTPRQNMAVRRGDQIVGEITSGCLSPTLGYPIAMAYVPPEQAEVGTTLNVDFGRKQVDAEVVKLPFYKPGG
jgi:aminomethyltransferase